LVALLLSSLYAGGSFLLQRHAERRFAAAMTQADIQPSRWLVAATPLNILYWRCLAETAGGFRVGYLSVLDASDSVTFEAIERHDELLGSLTDARGVTAVRKFSQGFYTVWRDGEGALWISDLRFGDVRVGLAIDPGPRPWSFSFLVAEDGTDIRQYWPERPAEPLLEFLTKFARRACGTRAL
jgi:hypothetical protein